MIDFLRNHFRYNTMNSWNQATSYAHDVKLYNLNLPTEFKDIAYEAISGAEIFDRLNYILSDFQERWNYNFTIGFNGRSGGYMVLYKSERKLSDYKSFCTACGQKNYTSIKENDGKCGVCGKPRIDKEFYEIGTYAGQGIDSEDDFEDWDIETLKERTKLVKDFDKTINDYKNAFIKELKNIEADKKENDYAKFFQFWLDEIKRVSNTFEKEIPNDNDLWNNVWRNLNSVKKLIENKTL